MRRRGRAASTGVMPSDSAPLRQAAVVRATTAPDANPSPSIATSPDESNASRIPSEGDTAFRLTEKQGLVRPSPMPSTRHELASLRRALSSRERDDAARAYPTTRQAADTGTLERVARQGTRRQASLGEGHNLTSPRSAEPNSQAAEVLPLRDGPNKPRRARVVRSETIGVPLIDRGRAKARTPYRVHADVQRERRFAFTWMYSANRLCTGANRRPAARASIHWRTGGERSLPADTSPLDTGTSSSASSRRD